ARPFAFKFLFMRGAHFARMKIFQFRNHRILHKLAICFSAIIVTAACCSAWIFHQRQTLAEADRWTDHTYQVIAEIDLVQRNLINKETGRRGSLVTGNPANLEPYSAGQIGYAEHLAKLKQLTNDSVAQQRRLDDVETASKRWGDEVAEPAIQLMGRD